MNIVADENIPYVHELFDCFGSVKTLPGRHMTSNDLIEADALLVRSVTNVNEQLLKKSNVGFVGTCTIGTDHLDTQYLEQRGIDYSSAPGCNAQSVVQYVLTVLADCGKLDTALSVGIVGCGNVGRRLHASLKAIGFNCRVYDPFLTKANNPDICEWGALFASDILCLHAPLTQTGPHPSHHMFNIEVLQGLKENTFLLNAGRGGVIDNQALLKVMGERKDLQVVLDVWENEPDINLALLKQVKIGTPHIAGYSDEGRTNGALMIFKALLAFLAKNEASFDEAYFDEAYFDGVYSSVVSKAFGEPEAISGETLEDYILATYNLSADHQRLLAAQDNMPLLFDKLRKNYPGRREFSHYRLSPNTPTGLSQKLCDIGFLTSV